MTSGAVRCAQALNGAVYHDGIIWESGGALYNLAPNVEGDDTLAPDVAITVASKIVNGG